jgi:hypothetical protein
VPQRTEILCGRFFFLQTNTSNTTAPAILAGTTRITKSAIETFDSASHFSEDSDSMKAPFVTPMNIIVLFVILKCHGISRGTEVLHMEINVKVLISQFAVATLGIMSILDIYNHRRRSGHRPLKGNESLHRCS